MAVQKLGENRWRVRVDTDRLSDGKRIRHDKVIHGTKKDAEAYERKVRLAVDTGEWREDSPETTEEYLVRWLADAARPRIAPATADMYQEFMNRYLAPKPPAKQSKRHRPYHGPTIGAIKLGKLAPLDVQGFYGGLEAHGLSGAFVRRIHGMLHAALEQAVRWGLIDRNPAGLVNLPKIRKREMHALDPDTAARFLEAAACDRHAVLWSFLLATGVRPGEALALRWADVDLKGGVVTIRRSLTWRRKGEYLFRDETKSGKGRPIPLPASLVPDLKSHKARQAEERLAVGAGWVDLDLVFPTELGTPHRRENITTRHLKPILKAAGLPLDFRLYDIRHSCATLLLANNTNPKIVSERLGHASVTLTLDTYSHVTPTMQEQASAALDKMLFAKPE